MDNERLIQALENALVAMIHKGDSLKIEYKDRIDVSKELKEAYANINFGRLQVKITEKLEECLAEKIVNKVVTEMGTDIKQLMSNNSIRDDFKFMLRKNVELVLEKLNKD